MSTSSVSAAPDPSESEQGIESLNPSFCANCWKLCILPEELDVRGFVYAEYTLEGIAEAVTGRCQLCCQFLNYLESGDSIQDLTGDKVFRACLAYESNASYDTRYLPHVHTIIFYAVEGTDLEARGGGLLLVISEYTLTNGVPFVFERHESNQPRPVRVTTALTSWTGDEAHLRTITKWVQQCEETHSACRLEKLQKKGIFIPTRLIDVSTADLPYLVTADTVCNQKDHRYITLSHRWQNADMPKLLSSNLHDFLRAIQPNTLPAVFSDAIDLCRRMSVPFLWIDALCLIQDDHTDCDREISSMGEIYANAFMHIGATGASNRASSGLYTEVDPIGLSPLYVNFQRGTRRFSRLLHEATAAKRINQSKLMSRGWVLQERLLSPRSIYFDDLLSWECTQLVTTELHPDGAMELPGRTGWGYDLPFKLPSLLGGNTMTTGTKTIDYHMRWLAVAEAFSGCQLTYDEDALPAISGLARGFQTMLQDRYVAGIWYKDAVRSILWIHQKKRKDSDDPSTCPEKSHRVPSWSWLSLKGRIRFLWLHSIPQQPSDLSLAHVREISMKHVQDDEFGKLASGYLRLACYIRKASDRPARVGSSFASQMYVYGAWCENFDDFRASCVGCWFCVLQIRGARRASSIEKELIWRPAHLVGIILEPVDLSQRIFRRVGLFAHPWGEHNTNRFKELCPEFADVTRLEDMEQEEVTII